MEDGGGDALTPQMVLAAARPPLEALGARDGRATGGRKGNMGLDEDWGEELGVLLLKRGRSSNSLSSGTFSVLFY